jgi:hypothetical protein
MSSLLLTALLFQAQSLQRIEKACPYVLVTRSGERIGSMDRPNHDGKPVKFRLCANTTLTLYPAGDVDWDETARANSVGAQPTPSASDAAGPGLTPTKATVSGYAKSTPLLDAESAVRKNQYAGKMKVGDREYVMDGSTGFFGQDSVTRYLAIGKFVADTAGCPQSLAQAYGIVRNVSTLRLRSLRALVVVGSGRAGEVDGQVQSMSPSELMPGEQAEITLWLPCEFASRSSNAAETFAVLLSDVAGRTESFEKPAPAVTPTPRRSP